MAFHHLEENGPEFLRERLESLEEKGADYCPANCWAWAEEWETQSEERDGFFFLRLRAPSGAWMYLCPGGEGDFEEAMAYIRACAQPGDMLLYTGEQKVRRNLADPDARMREMDEYLYEAPKYIGLRGKRFDGKRNHIARFRKACPDWHFEPLCRANQADFTAVCQAWAQGREGGGIRAEERAIDRLMSSWERLGALGGILYDGRMAVACALGGITGGKALDVVVEKALGIEGAYPMIAREFAAYAARVCRVDYINREDDMGMEALRRAKMSYHPDKMIEKYGKTLK